MTETAAVGLQGEVRVDRGEPRQLERPGHDPRRRVTERDIRYSNSSMTGRCCPTLARLGATVTGLDFSEESVREARTLAAETGDAVTYVQADVHDAPKVLPRNSFDLVYTGIGALCWLPRIAAWADAVSALLAPAGSLVMREAHPILLSTDESLGDDVHLRYPYFEHDEPVQWDDDQSYVPTSGPSRRREPTSGTTPWVRS